MASLPGSYIRKDRAERARERSALLASLPMSESPSSTSSSISEARLPGVGVCSSDSASASAGGASSSCDSVVSLALPDSGVSAIDSPRRALGLTIA